tara:strand:- start:171 stop:305 length:135 start_codon:yes stop_codon:yes gene_type:complete
MTREEAEKILREQIGNGELDEDDKEVAEANAKFEETSKKISLLL